MAAPVRFDDLCNWSMQRAYVDVTGSGGPVTLTEVQSLVNRHKRRVQGKIAQAVPFFYSTDYTFSTVSGTYSYALPSDFGGLQAIYVIDNTTTYRPLHVTDDVNRVRMQPPQAAYSMLMRYTPVQADLANANDTFDGVWGLDELIVCRVARDICIKKREDISALTLEIGELERELLDRISDRDQGQPTYVTEVESMDWPGAFLDTTLSSYQLRANAIELWSFQVNAWGV